MKHLLSLNYLLVAEPMWLRRFVRKRLSAHAIPGSSPTNACIHVQVCGSNGLAAILATKKSEDVTLEVNLRNLLHTSDEEHKWGIYSDYENQGRRHQKSKVGVLVVPQEGLMSTKNFFWNYVPLSILVWLSIIQELKSNVTVAFFIANTFWLD